eukprot:174265-Chlamydomonas_euryale.AAC.1
MERRGQHVPSGEDPGLAQYRERFFNFYDKRLMDGSWTKEADPRCRRQGWELRQRGTGWGSVWLSDAPWTKETEYVGTEGAAG